MAMRYLIFIVFFVFSICLAQNAIAEETPCSPEYSTECLLDELENMKFGSVIDNLLNRNEPLPAFVPAVKYASSGDLKTSKKFMRQFDVRKIKEDEYQYYPSRRAIDLLIDHGEDDELLKFIDFRLNQSKDKDARTDLCSEVVQWLAYKRENDLLNRVIEETECTTLYLFGACNYLNETEISSLLNDLAKVHSSPLGDNDKDRFFELSTVLCLSKFAHEETEIDPEIFTQHLLSLIDYENTHIEDKLQDRLISTFFLRKGYFDLAEQEVKKIKDRKLKRDSYQNLRDAFAEVNDERALKYDKLIGSDYPGGGRYNHLNDISYLLVNQIDDPVEKLERLTDFLYNFIEYGISRDSIGDLKKLIASCKDFPLEECIFKEIEATYPHAVLMAKDNRAYTIREAPERDLERARSLVALYKTNKKEFSAVFGGYGNKYADLLEKLNKLDSIESEDKKKQILQEVFMMHSSFENIYTADEYLEILQAAQSYLEKDYDFRLLSMLYERYRKKGWEKYANAMLESNYRFKAEFDLERKEREERKRDEDAIRLKNAFKLESQSERANELARQILHRMADEDNFSGSGRVDF